MPLSQKAIEELKTIYKDCYGEELSDDDAWGMGHRLLRLFYAPTRPPKQRDGDKKKF